MRVHFYDPATGLFTGRSFGVTAHAGAAAVIKANTPAGLAAFEGEVDPLSQRFDVTSGKLTDYQPPPPSAEHEWNPGTKRWQLTAAAAARQAQQKTARAQIHALEQSQGRAVREFLLGRAGSLERLEKLDADIAALRGQL